MIIQYTNERGYEGKGTDPNLTLKNQYICLSLSFYSNGKKAAFTVQCDSDGEPAQFDASFFQICDNRLPDGWIIEQQNPEYYGECSFCLSPIEFTGDFWDLYHDGDEEAEKKFAKVVKKLEGFHAIDN